MSKQLTSKQRQDLEEAIDYLFTHGYVDEMTYDKKYYTTILLNHAAKSLGYQLGWPET